MRAIFIAAGRFDSFWHPPVSTLSIFSQVITSSHLGRHTLARSRGSALKSLVLSQHPSSFSMCDLCLVLCPSSVSLFCPILSPSNLLARHRPFGAMTPAPAYLSAFHGPFISLRSLLTTPSSCTLLPRPLTSSPNWRVLSPATGLLDCIYCFCRDCVW